jgi:N-methylhydantoinase A
MAWRIGVDSGGTFTDVCLFEDASGRVEVWKVSSTPDDPSRGIAQGFEEGVGRVGLEPADVGYFGHGTTVATNALIQHKGVKTGLITTEGFRDLLEIGRQKRPDLYDLQVDKPPVLVARDLRLEVPERLRHDGTVETRLDEQTVREAVRTLRDASVEAVAVRIIAEEFPEAFACVSHDVAPEFREYERMSTTVVNAYLGPVMQKYIHRLAERLQGLGLKVPPHLTQSNGGVIGFDQAARLPVRTVLSGPSTGVVAAQAVGRMAGFENLITFDMGGTSTDVALLQNGTCRLASEAVVHGYPIKAPMLDIHTVGAGGGSIAYVDSGGLLKVGPRSAGAFPGPVCYGKGNDEPTVTDANVVLQTLNPTHLLGGRMKVDQGLAKAAIGRLAARLGMDVMATAQGILSVVIANMARAIRVISVQRGHDPRGLRRRRPAARRQAGERAGDQPHPGAAQPRHPVRHGTAADRPAGRLRHHPPADPVVRRPPRRGRRFSYTAPTSGNLVRRRSNRPRGAPGRPHRRHALRRAELRIIGAGARRSYHRRDAGSSGRRFRERAQAHVRLRC